jgi:hypothetical protein
MAERVSKSERTHETQSKMLNAASCHAADRGAVAGRLRDG